MKIERKRGKRQSKRGREWETAVKRERKRGEWKAKGNISKEKMEREGNIKEMKR